jgi:hypothetical protein
MTIRNPTLQFEQYLDGQVHAVIAVRKLVILDARIAQNAFNISNEDIITFQKVMPEILKQSALKNSQLFRLTTPSKEQLSRFSANKPLNETYFTSSQVKNCITSYCDAQRQCLLAIKSMYDINKKLAEAIFRLEQVTLDFIDSYNSFELSRLSDRYTWLINLNYSDQENIFKKTVERSSFAPNFLESSLLY